MAYEKTWQFIPVQGPVVTGGFADAAAHWLWIAKSFLKGEIGGATQGLWECAGSCDGVTAALDGVDRWGTTYDGALIPYSSSSTAVARGWMVLTRVLGGVQVWLTLGCGHGNNNGNGSVTFGLGGALPTTIATTSIPAQTIPLGGSQGTFVNSANLYAANATDGRRYFGAISTDGGFWVAQTILGEIAAGGMVFNPVGTKANDQWPIYAYYYDDGTASTTSHVFSGTSVTSPNAGSPAINTGKFYNSATGYSFISPGAPYVLLDAADVSLFDYPAWVLVGNSTAPTSMHSRGRLADCGLCASTGTGGATSAAQRPSNVGTTIRNQLNQVEYITMNQMIFPYNSVVS